jgi:uncharacterized protein YndB with AHSA1/START domain
MPEPHESGRSADSVTLRIAASPERVYAIVSDVTQMGRLSPECTGGRWLGGATGPAVGARFKGTNKRGLVRWSTRNAVVAATPGREFAFETKESGTRWSYRLEPDGDGTIVTESRAPWRERPLVARLAARLFLGGVEEHEEEMRAGLQATLERLKAVAEAPA